MIALALGYADGTHRLVPPEVTLARVAPHLKRIGVTRVAEITGLDRLGIPTFCAVRPYGRLIQVTNGKGLSDIAARVSAIMEAVEHAHVEQRPPCACFASMAELTAQGVPFLPVQALPIYVPGRHLSDHRRLAWIDSRFLLADASVGERILLPACAVYLTEPMLAPLSTNGMASGNHLVEASLHALFEVIERDAIMRLARGGLRLPDNESRLVDLSRPLPAPVAALRDLLAAAGVELALIRVASPPPTTTMWAVILDPAAPHACSRINMGHGAHLSPTVAATRAITEAAQSRLTFIHAAREDLDAQSYRLTPAHERLVAFFTQRQGDLPWDDLADHATDDLGLDLALVCRGLAAAGYDRVLRVDLTRPELGIPVVKMIVPGLAGSGIPPAGIGG
ncbi:putative methanogenesis marker protein 1 [Thiorhodovibrio winogradskyi]|uniref:Methanogenesis marker protein 1 n=1 Tax=Thiorhodovibrio winogradskyi TaxID=77007 RepID=A0ABZ0S670_9GAMM|nr:YcaO-like family protein [Thiorhodovibrio winogradskyi]